MAEQPHFHWHQDKRNLTKFLACVNFQLDDARKTYKYVGEKGEYVIRASHLNGDLETNNCMQFGWACSFTWSEPQPVNAAVWIKRDDKNDYLLVAIWTFSPTRDKTNVFLLDGYSTDVFNACGYGEDEVNRAVILHRDCDASFNIGSGDTIVTEFHCPVLENISIEEMEKYNAQIPKTVRTSAEVCAAHTPLYPNRCCKRLKYEEEEQNEGRSSSENDDMPESTKTSVSQMDDKTQKTKETVPTPGKGFSVPVLRNDKPMKADQSDSEDDEENAGTTAEERKEKRRKLFAEMNGGLKTAVFPF